MDIKIHTCENCENIITLNAERLLDSNGIFDCPLCGTLNQYKLSNKGNLVVTSHAMNCQDDISTDKVIIDELHAKVDDALRTLMSYGWKVKFMLDD